MRLILALTLYSLLCTAQNINHLCNLSGNMAETSGLIYLDGRLISHNDSGGTNKLYELDSISGEIIREVYITNSTNTDWEDLCYDNEYIYIADIGNNSGNRTNLKIYKLNIETYLSSDTINPEIISFNYEDQLNFDNQLYNTNFDAESLISVGDSLYIFTKNWSNGYSNIYSLPKNPGNYSASKIDSFDAQGLITSATYNTNYNEVLLTGYNFTNPFIIKLSNFHNGLYANGEVYKSIIEIPGSFQVEAIAHIENDKYYFTVESYNNHPAALYSFSTTNLNCSQINKSQGFAYPNPSDGILTCMHEPDELIKLYNLKGELLLSTTENKLDLSAMTKGIYILSTEKKGKTRYQQRIILK